MPPHCDSMDGPVVRAAMQALDEADVSLILPYVPKEGEREVINAFEDVVVARKQGVEAKEVADKWFFETVVRIHRAGEGAAFTGLKPAGLGHGLVVPIAEKAIETGTPEELVKLLCETVQNEVKEKFHHVMHLKEQAGESIDAARVYVSAMLAFEIYSHTLHKCIMSEPHHSAHHHE